MSTEITASDFPTTLTDWTASLPARAGWGDWDGNPYSTADGVQCWSVATDEYGHAVGVWGMLQTEDDRGEPLDEPRLDYSIYLGDCREPHATGYETAESAMQRAERDFPECFQEAAPAPVPTEINVCGTVVKLIGGELLEGRALPDLTAAGPDPTEQCDADGLATCSRYDLGDGLSLFVGRGPGWQNAEVSRETTREHLLAWYWDDLGFEDKDEFLTVMGLEPTLPEAGADYEGPCRVWHQPCYYQGTYGAPVAQYARDEQDAIILFPSYAEAAGYVAEYYSAPSGYEGIPACRVLSHGQAGPDTLTICRA